jgi:hypothetical protein
MVDPFVLPITGGYFRLYVPSEQEGIISAVSNDGLTFTRENGIRVGFGGGGMPRALLLPDNRVRLFVNGSHDGQDGIFSLISDDGLNFIAESGMRISAPAGFIINDAQPVRLLDGSYLMLYQMLNATLMDQPEPGHTPSSAWPPVRTLSTGRQTPGSSGTAAHHASSRRGTERFLSTT